jgi:hypothetical protein
MSMYLQVYTFVPTTVLADIGEILQNDVFPLVRIGPTRGGQINSQWLLRHEDGHYLWMVGYETTGGSWLEEDLAAARAKLESMGVIYAARSLLLLNKAVRDNPGGDPLHTLLPVGLPNALVRLYKVSPRHSIVPGAFEQAMAEQVLPAVRLHYGNRLGHSTDTQLLLQVERGPLPLISSSRYQWMVSRSYYEPFESRDSFPNDVGDALDKLKDVGNLHGFSDYRIVSLVDVQTGLR